MNRKLEDIPLEELEVSIRTAGVLEALPAKTVGELLALPVISATRLSLFELKEVFAELGVVYSGELRPTEKQVELIEAGGEVPARWETIKEWLADKHPQLLDGFAPSATQEQIAEAETTMGCTLPEDYKAFLAIHNGQKSDEPMVWTCSLIPVEKLAERKRRLAKLYDDPDQPPAGPSTDPAIKRVAFSDGWIPIGVSSRGRDFLCLDMDPSPDGNSGQLILIAVDAADHLLIAPSFREFLSLYFRQVQTGEIELLED